MSKLADLLESRLDELVRRWTDGELKDYLPDFLRQLVATLRGSKPPGDSSPVFGEHPVGREQGQQRFRLGFEVGAVVREYGVLRGCILDLVEESGCPVSLPEVRVLTDFISTAIAESVAEYERQAKRTGQAAEAHQLDEQRRAQEALRESEQRLRIVIDALPTLINFVGTDQRYLLNNKAYESWFGVSLELLRGKTVREVVGEENYGRVRPYIERALRGERVTYHVPFVFAGGRRGSIEGTHLPQVASDGRVLGYVTLVSDVTERHAAETALRAREEQVRGLLDSTSEGIWGLDTEGRCTFANPACARLLGYDSAEELVGRDMHELVHHSKADGTRCPKEACAIRDTFRWGREVEHDDVLWRRQGTPLNVRYRSSPLLRDGQVVGAVVAFEDITARQQAEAALRESEARLRAILSALEEGITLHDASGMVLFANAAAERHTGLGAQQFAGRTPFDPRWRAVREDGRAYPGEEHPLIRALRTGKRISGDVMGIHQPDGRLVWLSINAQPVFEADGKTLVGAVSSFFDITERKAAAEALRESEGRLSQLLRASVAGTWEVNPLTGKGTADAPLRALHAFPPDGEFDVETALATIHPEDQERIRDAVSAALAGHDAGRYFSEYRVMRPEGGIRWVEARGQASLDAAGKAVRFLGTCLDITRRKAAEFAREGLLEALAAQPSLLVCVVRGPRFILQLAPPLYLQRVARGRDIRGQPLLEAVPELKSQGFEELLTRVLETGVPFVGREISARFDQGDGTLEEGFFDVVYQPVRGEGGTYDSMLLISHEVTSVVHSRRRAERLAAEEKTRADFEQQLIGIVSHDLRNPLGAILLGTKALARREELDERSTKAVMRIQASAERAVRLVKDLLDFTQARLGGGLPIARAPMDLHALVSQVAEEVQANFPERELRVETQGQGQGEWDLDRVAQVVTNLTSNALKYGRPGTPVTVRTRGDGDWVALEVHNQGTPIPPEAREHLFEPLQRATAQADTVGRSVGLGLYIVKHIVDAHGGGIDVTSTETEGTTFTVRLPRHARPPV